MGHDVILGAYICSFTTAPWTLEGEGTTGGNTQRGTVNVEIDGGKVVVAKTVVVPPVSEKMVAKRNCDCCVATNPVVAECDPEVCIDHPT